MTAKTRITKLAPPHNPLQAPAMCMCVECCRKVLALRCPVRDKNGNQCGDYRHRGKTHSPIPATVFLHAEERVRLDG